MRNGAPLAVLGLFVAAAAAQTPPDDAPTAPGLPDFPTASARATWSEVTGKQGGLTAKDRASAVIRRVDGQFATEPRVKMAPGEHDVVVQSPPRHGFGGTERHLRLKAEPCRRYYVNAQYRSATGAEWTPVIAKSEAILGCRTPPAR